MFLMYECAVFCCSFTIYSSRRFHFVDITFFKIQFPFMCSSSAVCMFRHYNLCSIACEQTTFLAKTELCDLFQGLLQSAIC